MKLQIIDDTSNQLLFGIEKLIERTSANVAIYLNTKISSLYWSIGNYIATEMQYETYSRHGQQILATLSQRLTERFGKGYTYSALTRMIKVAEVYDEEMFATLSQTLSWSHFIELVSIDLVARITEKLGEIGGSGEYCRNLCFRKITDINTDN